MVVSIPPSLLSHSPPFSFSLSFSALSYPCVNCNARRAYTSKYAFLYCRTEVAAAVAFPPLRSSSFHLLSASFTFEYIWHVIWYAMPCLIWHAMPWYGMPWYGLLCSALVLALLLVLLFVPLCSVLFCFGASPFGFCDFN